MSLTRKFLSALGIEADKIDEIILAHTESTEALKAQLAESKANADKLTETKAELDKVRKDLEKANATIEAANKDDYKGKYESEKAAHEKLKADIQSKETTAKKSTAFKSMLKDKGYSENAINKITKYGGYVDGLELDDEGNVKDVEKLIGNIESEWSEYKPIEKHINHTPRVADQLGDNKPKSEIAAAMQKFNAKYDYDHYGVKPDNGNKSEIKEE